MISHKRKQVLKKTLKANAATFKFLEILCVLELC